MTWMLLLLTIAAPTELRFEAEAYSMPSDAWVPEAAAADKWTLWSTDVDADKKWSGGVVLRSPTTIEDRARPEDGAPALHTRITGVPAGVYDVELPKIVRSLGYSFDGQRWHPLRGGGVIARRVRIDGTYDLWVDDKYAHPDHPGPAYYDYLALREVEGVRATVWLGRLTHWLEVWR